MIGYDYPNFVRLDSMEGMMITVSVSLSNGVDTSHSELDELASEINALVSDSQNRLVRFTGESDQFINIGGKEIIGYSYYFKNRVASGA